MMTTKEEQMLVRAAELGYPKVEIEVAHGRFIAETAWVGAHMPTLRGYGPSLEHALVALVAHGEIEAAKKRESEPVKNELGGEGIGVASGVAE